METGTCKGRTPINKAKRERTNRHTQSKHHVRRTQHRSLYRALIQALMEYLQNLVYNKWMR